MGLIHGLTSSAKSVRVQKKKKNSSTCVTAAIVLASRLVTKVTANRRKLLSRVLIDIQAIGFHNRRKSNTLHESSVLLR